MAFTQRWAITITGPVPNTSRGRWKINSIPVLMNDAVPIERNGARLWIAGVDDVWQRRADLDLALRHVPATEPTVLLAHEPDYAELAKRYPIDLQLSGHSHGGQVRLPFYGAPILPYLAKIYSIGLERADAMWVYTNRGIGVVSPPVRFNCRPEDYAVDVAISA